MTLEKKLSLSQKPAYLIDGNAFFYRGFYAYRDMRTSDGRPSNAVFFILRLLLKILHEQKPEHIVFFLDGKGKNFRHELYPAYKAQRQKRPEELTMQTEPMMECVKLLGITVICSENFEADDYIASYAEHLKKEMPIVIVGADKDFKQCLDENVFLWDPVAKSEKLTTIASFQEESSLTPQQWAGYQALIGDSADNIPGVPGIGPKTALQIMKDYPTLEDIQENIDKLPAKIQTKLADNFDDAFLFRKLTTLATESCTPHAEDMKVQEINTEALLEFLKNYEFKSLMREYHNLFAEENATAIAGKNSASTKNTSASTGVQKNSQSNQLSLFDSPKPLITRDKLSAEQFPLLKEKNIALLMLDDGLCISLDNKEFIYAGDISELIPFLKQAKILITHSVQNLLRADDIWKNIPLEKWFDLSIASYLLNPEERNYDLANLKRKIFSHDFESTQDIQVQENTEALALSAYYVTIHEQIKNAHLEPLLNDIELPLVSVLVAMEKEGIAIDKQAFQSFLKEVSTELDKLKETIYKHANKEFNIRSSQQLGEVLFTDLGLKTGAKTPTGALSTASDVLEKLLGQHPVIDALLEFRTLEKLRSTYLEPLPLLADKNDRIYTHFNQLATATGRLSSSNPNLQNIPVRGKQGERMRSCFIAKENYSLVGADYSQIELRVLSHFSEDPELLRAYQEDADIHTRTAALLFDVAAEDVSTEQRRNAKTINFGIVYGMGPQKLSKELGISTAEAKAFIERYFEKLSILRKFYEKTIIETQEIGYVTTLTGRRRIIADIHSQNALLFSQAKRQAINTVIQGSAADIIKLAMIEVHKNNKLQDLGAKLLLQIHDELLLEVPKENASAASIILKELMEGIVTLKVPLKVDLGIGNNWSETH